MEINFSMILFYKSDLLDIDAHSCLPMVFFFCILRTFSFQKTEWNFQRHFFSVPFFLSNIEFIEKKFGISSNWKQMSQRYHIF